MAIIVEDGTGLATAETYVSVLDADAYHLAYGNTAWAVATNGDKEIALRRAAQYIDTRYTFLDDRLRLEDQALEFPRDDGADWPVRAITQATCELALRALPGALTVDQDAAAIIREKIGPLETEYARPRFGGQTRYAIVDDLLAALTGGRYTMRVERAS